MFRGNRLLIIAVGLALACANHAQAKGGNEQPKARQTVETSLEHIAARDDDSAKRAERADLQEAPCGPKQYGSRADLCAQWKAADAASDSAWWAWAGGIVGVGSLLGVLVAIGLAFHSNWIARDSARREHRAYVRLTLDKDRKALLEVGKPFVVVLDVLNYGLTPALNGSFQFTCGIVANDWEWPDKHVAKRNSDIKGILHRDTPILCPIATAFSVTEEHIEAIRDGNKRWLGLGVYFYDDVFGHERMTQISLVLTGEDLERESITLGREGHIST